MKAVVMEIKDGYAALLTEDGQFIKVTDNNYETGMELSLEEIKNTKKKSSPRRKWIRNASAIAAALLIVLGVKDFNTPYGTISLDVNPSIEISINRYDRVLSIEAVNEDADDIVSALQFQGIKYKSLQSAVDMALNSFEEGSYEADDGTTYVMISSYSQSSTHSDKINENLENLCSEHKDISAQAITADEDLIERADEAGTTAGKLYLVDQLKEHENTESFDENEWLRRPVKDIVKELNSDPAGESSSEIPAPEKQKEEQPQLPSQPSRVPEESSPAPTETTEPSAPPQQEDGNRPSPGDGNEAPPKPDRPEDRPDSEVSRPEGPQDMEKR